MDYVCASRSISPPEAFVAGVIVNAEGRRFINEDAYTATLGRSIAEAPSAAAWLILDRPSLRRALRHSLPGSGRLLLIHCLPALMLILFGSRKGRSFAELAQRCGLPPAALQQSLEDYNRAASAGAADEFGKNAKFCHPLIGPPYYALDISLRSRTAPLPTFSLGGLAVDEDTGAVKRLDGTLLQGLFAAGRAAVGLPSNRYLSGLALADCVFSGRRAGQHAALGSTRGVLAC
jgi:3-oxo-5alpha-steroid 4-dehydrogenase